MYMKESAEKSGALWLESASGSAAFFLKVSASGSAFFFLASERERERVRHFDERANSLLIGCFLI